MGNFAAKNIRNIVLLGHQSCGKTSLVESLALATGLISAKGEVEKKNTLSDYSADEQKRGSSIQTAVIPLTYRDTKINIIDVPGNDDFISEYMGALNVVDGAILLIDASTGIQVGTVKHFNRLKKHNVPTIILVNKTDKDGANYDDLLKDIHEKLSKTAVTFAYPMGVQAAFKGFVDCVSLKAYDLKGNETDAGEYAAQAEEAHGAILEEVAKTDDALLDKFFMGEEFTDEEVKTALGKGIASEEIIPVIAGSVLNNVGIKTILDMIVDYVPSPVESRPLKALDESQKETTREVSDEAPLSAYVFKTIVDPYSGTINLIKVCSGVLKTGDDVAVNGATQRVSMMYSVCGKKLDTTTELHTGDIGAITRLENVKTGATLSSPKAVCNYVGSKAPSAVLFKGIVLKNKNDESKIGPSLAKIQSEDPAIEVKRNNETKQLLLGGLSNSHLDYVLEKLKTIYKIEVEVEPMKVVYRESIKKIAEGDGRYVKQSGGSGFYGVVKMRFEPCEESCFAEEVFGGAVPKNYFPAVEKGFFETLKSGPLAGFPVIGVKGVLIDGKYHPVDSNEQAFKLAASLAFKDAYPKCSPIILEPIMRIHVVVPMQYTGDVMSDLNTRRARIQNMEEKDGNQDIEALIPEAEIIDYASQLKSVTQASGFFTREFESYEEVPSYLTDKVIKENKVSE